MAKIQAGKEQYKEQEQYQYTDGRRRGLLYVLPRSTLEFIEFPALTAQKWKAWLRGGAYCIMPYL
jgi:hypothetical protein